MKPRQFTKLSDGIAILVADGNFTPTLKEIASVSGISYGTIRNSREYQAKSRMLIHHYAMNKKSDTKMGAYDTLSYAPTKVSFFSLPAISEDVTLFKGEEI